MKILNKIILGLFALLILWVAFHFLIIGGVKTGVVVDSVTQKPLEGIHLVRALYYYTSNLEGSYSAHPVRYEATVTDKDGRFSLSPFIKMKMWLNKADKLFINPTPNYYFENGEPLQSVNTKYFMDVYGSGFSRNYGMAPDNKFNKNIIVGLIPIVSNISECNGNGGCIEKNKDYARDCLKRSLQYEGKVCGGFAIKGVVIFKNDKPFGDDITNDFAECDNKKDDASSAYCFYTKQHENVMFSEETCSAFDFESTRNLCYYFLTIGSSTNNLCDKITKKPFPDETVSYASDGVSNYKDLCIKERTRMYGR